MTTAVVTDVLTTVPDVEAQPRLRLLDDPDAVEAWLRSCDPHKDVGDVRRAHSCPLATYLQVHNKQVGDDDLCYDEQASVAGRGYLLGGVEYVADQWAGRFVFLVDAEPGSYVTAGRALELLALARDTERHLPWAAASFTPYNPCCGCPPCARHYRDSGDDSQ